MNPRMIRRSSLVITSGMLAVLASLHVAASSPQQLPTPHPSPLRSPWADGSTPPASEDPGPGRHADVELEAFLPDSLGGAFLTRESQRGVDLIAGRTAIEPFLDHLGKTIDDFSLASAYSGSGDIRAQVGAWRVVGAEPAALLTEYIAAVQGASTTPLTVAEETVAGQAITRIGSPGELTQGPLYVFGRGDILLFVQTPDPELAEEAIGKLAQGSAPAS